MKNAFVVVLVAVVGLVACSAEPDDAGGSTSTAASATAVAPNDLAVCSATADLLGANGVSISDKSVALLDAAEQASDLKLKEAATWIASNISQENWVSDGKPPGEEPSKIIQDFCTAAGQPLSGLPS